MLQQMRSSAKYIWIIMLVTFVGGFLLVETSGLLGRSPVSTSSVVAKVNGADIPYLVWANTAATLAQQEEQQRGHALTLDERRQIDEQAFNQLVTERLLQQEYEKRGIHVTDSEIIEAAKYQPPPQFRQAAELQTEGQFDPVKYQRFLASPGAKQQGLLAQLEGYYRTEIPKEKLFSQVAGDVFVSDTRLWQIWRDTHDSATVSFVAFRPEATKENKAAVTDAEIQKYYEAHKKEFDRPGRATLSIVEISRRATTRDSLATRKKVEALRDEIMRGAKFEDVAKRESDDSSSGKEGGLMAKGVRGRFVKEFEDVAYKLPVGELSQPVATAYGFHLIKVDARKGDTITVRHILKLVHQGDSAQTATDSRADTLAKLAGSADVPAKFDSAAKALKLLVSRITVREGQLATYLGREVPSVSAWAFGGAKVGESSELFDDERGYYLVRLDSLVSAGIQPLAAIKDEVRGVLAREKALDTLVPKAKALAEAAAHSTFEAAAKAQDLQVRKVGPFTRISNVVDLGGVSEAVGAAFALPVGPVSAPIRTEAALFVLRTDARVEADRKAWEAQKAAQRAQVTRGMRDQRVRLYIDGLRKTAKIDDRRKQIQSAQRKQVT
ncbi:MAG TPA: peptidyl-prolyl cis-trans isomerase [Gemmatimonadaceae bacterium]|nr:peptidyl-prolyl cis-trans isomerase [Gemmatimonadaceae bacterium]